MRRGTPPKQTNQHCISTGHPLQRPRGPQNILPDRGRNGKLRGFNSTTSLVPDSIANILYYEHLEDGTFGVLKLSDVAMASSGQGPIGYCAYFIGAGASRPIISRQSLTWS